MGTRVVKFSREAVAEALATGGVWCVTDGLPADAVVEDVDFDADRGVFGLHTRSVEWEGDDGEHVVVVQGVSGRGRRHHRSSEVNEMDVAVQVVPPSSWGDERLREECLRRWPRFSDGLSGRPDATGAPPPAESSEARRARLAGEHTETLLDELYDRGLPTPRDVKVRQVVVLEHVVGDRVAEATLRALNEAEVHLQVGSGLESSFAAAQVTIPLPATASPADAAGMAAQALASRAQMLAELLRDHPGDALLVVVLRTRRQR